MLNIRVPAYAKINLYLSVVGKRDDGYHDIESVMQTISYYDTVDVTLGIRREGEPRITLTTTDPALPCDRRNIAYRAAEMFLDDYKVRFPGGDDLSGPDIAVKIHIEKRIPVAAGLAGGSADGAAVLRALNSFAGEPLPLDGLCRLGAKLGADVPFCIRGGTALLRGIGDLISPLPPMPGCSIVLVRPHEAVSTAEAYAAIDARGFGDAPALTPLTDALGAHSVTGVADAMYNVFESVMAPGSEIHTVKAELMRLGARSAMMSGSGPSVFAIFTDKDKARRAAKNMEHLGFDAYSVEPVEYNTSL